MGEITGDAVSALIERDLRQAFAAGTLTRAEAEQMVLDWRAKGVELARVTAGLAAALARGDVNTGADAGGNAAENNAFWVPIIVVIAVALEVGDKVLMASDPVDVAFALNACNNGDMAACSRTEELAKQTALDAGIELTIGSVIPGSKAGTDLMRWLRKNADANTIKAIDGVADGYLDLSRPTSSTPSNTILGELDELGRPTGVVSTINPSSLGSGTPANPGIRPPGFEGVGSNHARGHLLARMLGEAGDDARNLVTLFQRNANHPNMSSFERQVYAAVQGGETVNFRAIPIYSGNNPMPIGVT
ncbi:DNA/RNA non-specific endonuclease [Rhizobium sp. RU33A]|uniref:DNA/RNA non-specific endonuclease n=1 Tax=Rhizobium sp. RU33A TaxID=1907413 RepID=UPI000953A07F|nr:DNA/RNA non-specific endonuclease [Rhizobium sp. RU33A]SIR15896.1 DNA/RNA non-specific endonuclease [Rhizobium sp. RU33A]